jgi:hypothetical protein
MLIYYHYLQFGITLEDAFFDSVLSNSGIMGL